MNKFASKDLYFLVQSCSKISRNADELLNRFGKSHSPVISHQSQAACVKLKPEESNPRGGGHPSEPSSDACAIAVGRAGDQWQEPIVGHGIPSEPHSPRCSPAASHLSLRWVSLRSRKALRRFFPPKKKVGIWRHIQVCCTYIILSSL